MITSSALNILLAVALTRLKTTGCVVPHRALCHAVALLAPCDGVVAKSVDLALGAWIIWCSCYERSADALSCLFITCSCWRTAALLAFREAKVFWFTPGTLAPNNIGLALALPTKAVTLVVFYATLCITLALQGSVVEQ